MRFFINYTIADLILSVFLKRHSLVLMVASIFENVVFQKDQFFEDRCSPWIKMSRAGNISRPNAEQIDLPFPRFATFTLRSCLTGHAMVERLKRSILRFSYLQPISKLFIKYYQDGIQKSSQLPSGLIISQITN